MIKRPDNKQHHSNLREALILAGMQLLEEKGLDALTLRRCAAMAGVSHAAPAHHFDGLAGLKTAIATRGYATFERLMKEGVAAAGPEPRAQAYGMSLGYIRFATEHNALFNLIFDRPDKFTGDRNGSRRRKVRGRF
jgi:AcrR family transcriptional regulator